MVTTTVPTYFSGDTVRFFVVFRDYPDDPQADPSTGALIDPAEVTVKVFDAEETPVFTGTGVVDSVGTYTIDYTMPNEPGTYFIEWKGLINSKPEVKRDKFKVKFYVAGA